MTGRKVSALLVVSFLAACAAYPAPDCRGLEPSQCSEAVKIAFPLVERFGTPESVLVAKGCPTKCPAQIAERMIMVTFGHDDGTRTVVVDSEGEWEPRVRED